MKDCCLSRQEQSFLRLVRHVLVLILRGLARLGLFGYLVSPFLWAWQGSMMFLECSCSLETREGGSCYGLTSAPLPRARAAEGGPRTHLRQQITSAEHMSTDSDVLPEYGHTPPVEAPLCSLTFRDGMVWTFSFVLLILQYM